MTKTTYRLLVQWIGHSDLRAMARDLQPSERQLVLLHVGGGAAEVGDEGPIRTLLANESFDEIKLLSNYPPDFNRWFCDWIKQPAEVVPVELPSPTDYAAIYRNAEQALNDIQRQHKSATYELCLHLSPGTPAMASIWLLLGKTRYPAKFFETHKGRSKVVSIPFDLTLDLIPELLETADRHWQHLASEHPGEIVGFEDVVGDSCHIRDAVGRAKRVALRSVSTLILGESGTGKELFAKAIHAASSRRDRPFVAINCAALSQTLLESQLFGHKKGTFTGADRDFAGAFEQADGGTLFLDEVGECHLETQAKLLRALQPIDGAAASTRMVRRLGDQKDSRVNVRIIAATNRDLLHAISAGTFREDLFYRLATVTIRLPALRERRSDIPLIAERLLADINRQFASEEPGYEHKTLSASAKVFVKQQTWPGNVRQLYNVLVQAAVLADQSVLSREDLAAALGELPAIISPLSALDGLDFESGFDLKEHLNRLQEAILRRAMQQTKGNKSKAAKLLGFENYQTLAARLKQLGITISDIDTK